MGNSGATFTMRPMAGTDQPGDLDALKCVQCGSNSLQVLRADKTNPRLKCLQCKFAFDAEQSREAATAGEIPSSSPETLASADKPETIYHNDQAKSIDMRQVVNETGLISPPPTHKAQGKVPRQPAYVFISKTRTKHEFCSAKDVKRTTLRWEEVGKYDLFELVPKSSSVKVDIQ